MSDNPNEIPPPAPDPAILPPPFPEVPTVPIDLPPASSPDQTPDMPIQPQVV